MKLVIGFILAICVGVACRFFGIPLPGPPAILGAAMAVAMATGYTATDTWLARRSDSANTAKSSINQGKTSPTELGAAPERAGHPSESEHI
jgi:XapX domain-containing protein